MNTESQRIGIIIPDLFESTEKLIFENKPTNFYYLINLFQTYRSKFKTSLLLKQFYEIINEIDNLKIVLKPSLGKSLVCKKEHFDKNIVLKLQLSDTPVENDDSESNNSLSSDCAINVTKVTKKIVPVKRKGDKIEFEEAKEIIISSFQDAILCPISSLNQATIDVYGSAFDYKKAKCPLGVGHPHSSLSKYLVCCKDIIELKRYNSMFIKRKDFEAVSILEKRRRLHLGYLNSADAGFHIELMIVNLFPVKVTIEFNDLLLIFEDIYQNSLKSVLGTDPKYYFQTIDTENIRLLTNNDRTTITLIPSWSKEYKQFGDPNNFLKVQELNFKSFSKLSTITEKIPEKIVLGKLEPNYYKTLEGIFGTDDLLEYAVWNIPKCVQKPVLHVNLNEVFVRNENKNRIDLKWFYINQNVLL